MIRSPLASRYASAHLCAVCSRQSRRAFGVGEGRRVPLIWVCSHRCHMAALRTHRHLLSDDLAHYERLSREAAGAKAAAYLDALGEHDWRRLSDDEKRALLHTQFDAYHEAMVTQLERVYEASRHGRCDLHGKQTDEMKGADG